jgi:hypothetical protein
LVPGLHILDDLSSDDDDFVEPWSEKKKQKKKKHWEIFQVCSFQLLSSPLALPQLLTASPLVAFAISHCFLSAGRPRNAVKALEFQPKDIQCGSKPTLRGVTHYM